MLFILFDVEAVFLYPWAVILRQLKMFGFWEMLVYIGIVLVGFFYIWKKGVLDWSRPEGSSAGRRQDLSGLPGYAEASSSELVYGTPGPGGRG
jgi:hypothetical protein